MQRQEASCLYCMTLNFSGGVFKSYEEGVLRFWRKKHQQNGFLPRIWSNLSLDSNYLIILFLNVCALISRGKYILLFLCVSFKLKQRWSYPSLSSSLHPFLPLPPFLSLSIFSLSLLELCDQCKLSPSPAPLHLHRLLFLSFFFFLKMCMLDELESLEYFTMQTKVISHML